MRFMGGINMYTPQTNLALANGALSRAGAIGLHLGKQTEV